MIVATRPDPTVRPPSRYLNTVFLHIFYAFGWQNPHKTAVFTQCIFICLSSWHRFGTVGTSSSFTTINLNYRSASTNRPRPLWIFAPAPSIAPAIMIAATIIAIAIIILPIRCWYSFIVMSPFKFIFSSSTSWDLSLALFVTSPLIIQYATTHYFSTRAYSLTNPSSCITSKTISSPYSMWEYPPSE